MGGPTSNELRVARDRFRALLASRTKESEWQRFFSKHPYILSMSFPLKLQPNDILPLGRPGKAEPDFVFYPQDKNPVPFYGVIEMKRPDSKILTVTLSNVVLLSSDAETAIEQAKFYARAHGSLLPSHGADKLLFLGNRAHLFVIMGLSQELITKLGIELYKEIIERKFPDNIQLIPYDVLLQLFELNVPPRVYFLSQAIEQTIEGEEFELKGRVESAGFHTIRDDIPGKGTYLAVEFFETDHGNCIVIRISRVDEDDLGGIEGGIENR